MTTLSTLTDKATELGKEAQESFEDLSKSAGKCMDRARDETGDALHTAATSVRSSARQGCATIDSLAKKTATRLDATASYVEGHDLKDVWADLRSFGLKHPAISTFAAVAIGFAAGSAMTRATHHCNKS